MNSHTSFSRFGSSTLFATSSTGLPARCRTLATCASSSIVPTVTSTTKRMTSASAIARSAWYVICFASASSLLSQPPVSTIRKLWPAHSATSSLRSRVTPGCSSTIVARRPTIRFTNVDLPTFGRPTTATIGSRATGTPSTISSERCRVSSSSRSGMHRRRHEGGAVGRRRPRPVEGGRRPEVPSRNWSFDSTTSGISTRSPASTLPERAGHVRAGQQAGHADVAAEELVLHREQPHPGPGLLGERGQQRGEHRLAVGAGEDRDRRAGTVAARVAHREPAVGLPRRAVALGRRAVDPREEAGAGPGRLLRAGRARRARRAPRTRRRAPCRSRSRAARCLRTRRAAGTDARP